MKKHVLSVVVVAVLLLLSWGWGRLSAPPAAAAGREAVQAEPALEEYVSENQASGPPMPGPAGVQPPQEAIAVEKEYEIVVKGAYKPRSGKVLLLNSMADYQDPKCITLSVPLSTFPEWGKVSPRLLKEYTIKVWGKVDDRGQVIVARILGVQKP